MFIIYTNYAEAIVCTPETEAETLKLYFTEGERNLDDYDREVRNDCAISFDAKISLD